MGKPPKTYPESIANQLASKLEHLAKHPKGLQVKELVFRMRSKIEAAQACGYTLEDIVSAFKEEGVELTLNTLKQYLRESRALHPHSESLQLPDPAAKAAKPKKSNLTTSPEQPSTPPATPQTDQAISEVKEQVKSPLTNTNAEGFQEMRDDL